MLLRLLAYFGGAVTVVSACILRVMPFVFARAVRPFLSQGAPDDGGHDGDRLLRRAYARLSRAE